MRMGYLINIESSLNVDIDFNLTSEQIHTFCLHKAIYSEYSYVDDDDGEFKQGHAYRTRLKGIAIRKDAGRRHGKLLSQSLSELRDVINRCGGFILYEIEGVDTFNRVIATIYDPITNMSINDIFLHPKYELIFRSYKKDCK